MATQTITPEADRHLQRRGTPSQRWTEATRKASNDYLDLYDKAVDQIIELEVKTAAATKLPLVSRSSSTRTSR